MPLVSAAVRFPKPRLIRNQGEGTETERSTTRIKSLWRLAVCDGGVAIGTSQGETVNHQVRVVSLLALLSTVLLTAGPNLPGRVRWCEVWIPRWRKVT